MLRKKYTILLLFAFITHVSTHGQVVNRPANGIGAKAHLSYLISKTDRTRNNPDSLQLLIKEFTTMNARYHDKTAMIYATFCQAQYAWLKSDFYRSMQLGVSTLKDAQKYKVTRLLPEIYALIGDLHKENTNYPMAFIAAQNGLDAAIQNRDTAEIIQLLGLKAMFIRGYNLHFGYPFDKDSSLVLRLQGLKLAEANPKYERVRIPFYDNIAQHYDAVKDYSKAKYYGQKGVDLALKYNQPRSLTYSYSALAEACYRSGDTRQGMEYFNKALLITNQLKLPYRKMELYDAMTNCYASSGDYKDAFSYLSKYRWLQDSLQVRVNVKQLSELQIKYETAKKDAKISSLKAKSEIEELEYGGIITVLILLVIIGALIYLKENKRKKLALTEKCLIETELKNAALELRYFTENIKQKNELIEEFKAKLEHLHSINLHQSDIVELEQLVKENIMTDESWSNFKRLFSKVHIRFFSSIKKKYPAITDTDTRILALQKLGLSTTEMANMLGVTIDGIKKSKHRLRKKMELHSEETLENIVERF